MRTRVKICGNRTKAEALGAIAYGADAIGILVGPHTESQKHFVDESTAAEIIASLPPFAIAVIVTTYSTFESIRMMIEVTHARVVQCHSDIRVEDIAQLRAHFPAVRFIAVVHVTGMESIAHAKQSATAAHALLLDTGHGGVAGGTGVTHDWELSAQIVKSVSIPVILAGGLSPDNVRGAIEKVRPYAVDVRSGVCTPIGEKDAEKLQAFINNAYSV